MLTVRGIEGSLRWGYLPAGTLRTWTVTREDNVWSLTATLVRPDTYRLSQRPLTFVAQHEKGHWRWPIESLSIADTLVTARLGPPER